jgi:hypothetical protein
MNEKLPLISCDQKLSDLSPTSCGRFCHSCQKELFDFRQMSNDEILAIHQSTRGKVCGMYKEEQVEVVKTISPKGLSMQGWKAWYLGFLGILFAETADAQEVSDSTKIEQMETSKEGIQMGDKIYSYRGGVIRTLDQSVLPDTLVVSGIVKDRFGEPMIGTSILLADFSKGIASDQDGKFFIQIESNLIIDDSLRLVFSYVGFYDEKISIPISEFLDTGKKEIFVQLDECNLEEIVFIGTYAIPWRKRVWYGIKRFFRFEWLKKD